MKFHVLLVLVLSGDWIWSNSYATPIHCVGCTGKSEESTTTPQNEHVVVKRDDLEDKVLPQNEEVSHEENTETLVVKGYDSEYEENTELVPVKRDDSADRIQPQLEQVLPEEKTESVAVKPDDFKILPLDEKAENITVKYDKSGERILSQFQQVSEEENTVTIVVKRDDVEDSTLPQVPQKEDTKTLDDMEEKIVLQDEQVSQELNTETIIAKRDDLAAKNATKRQLLNETDSLEFFSDEANSTIELLLENQEYELYSYEGNGTAKPPARRSVNDTELLREKRDNLEASNETVSSEETNTKIELLIQYDDGNETETMIVKSVTSVHIGVIPGAAISNHTSKSLEVNPIIKADSFLELLLGEEYDDVDKTATDPTPIIEDKPDEPRIPPEALLEIDEQAINKTAKRPVRSLLAVTGEVEAPSTPPNILRDVFMNTVLANRYLRSDANNDMYISCTCVIYPYHDGNYDNISSDYLPIISKKLVKVTGERAASFKRETCLRICTDSAELYLNPETANCRALPYLEDEQMDANVNRVICNMSSREFDEVTRKLSQLYTYMNLTSILCLIVLLTVIAYFALFRKHRQVKVYHSLNLLKVRTKKTDGAVDVECIGMGIAACKQYYDKDGDNRKYRANYVVWRHDDARVSRLKTQCDTTGV